MAALHQALLMVRGGIQRGVPWNSADKSASVTLSSSDFTATSTVATSEKGVRTTQPATPLYGHKTRVEFKLLVSPLANVHVGLATIDHAFTNNLGYDVESFGISINAGDTYYNSQPAGLLSNMGAGIVNDVYEIEYDDIYFWARKNGAGNWNNDVAANPATNAGGRPHFLALGKGIYPCVRLYENTHSINVRTDASAYTYAGSGSALGIAISPITNVPYTGAQFDPATKSASVLLSGRGLVVYAIGAGEKGARTVNPIAIGAGAKTYFEYTALNTNGNDHWGICDSTHAFTQLLGFDTHSVGASCSTGTIYYNGGSIGSTAFSVATTDTVQMAVTDTQIWYRKNNTGNWNNNGAANPATGVGGLNHNLSGAWYPSMRLYNDTSAFLARFAAGDLKYALPSGFSAVG